MEQWTEVRTSANQWKLCCETSTSKAGVQKLREKENDKVGLWKEGLDVWILEM